MNVLVIGAGIGGLALAAEIGRKHPTTVLERAPRFRAAAWSLTLWPNGLRPLARLGLDRSVRAAGWPLRESVITTPRGRVLSRTRVARTLAGSGGAIAIDRAALHGLLLDAAIRAGASVKMRSIVAEVRNEGEQAVALERNGTVHTADLVVGADGLRSAARRAILDVEAPQPLGITFIRGLCPAGDFSLQAGRAFECWGQGLRFGAVQISAERVCWFAGLRMPPDESPRRPLDMLRRTFADWHAPIPQLIDSTSEADIIATPIFDRPPIQRRWSGRVVLIGDAAHPMTPDLGQGACTAIQDACALGEALRREASVEGALREFERRTVATANQAVRASHRAAVISQVAHPWICWARDVVLSLTPTALVERSLLKMARPGAG